MRKEQCWIKKGEKKMSGSLRNVVYLQIYAGTLQKKIFINVK